MTKWLIIKINKINNHKEAMKISSEVSDSLKFKNIENFIGKEIEIKGTVFKTRILSGFGFVLIYTSGSIIQSVFNGDLGATGIKDGCSLKVKGTVKEASLKDAFVHPKNCELVIESFEILSTPTEPMPFDITKKKLDILNDTKFDFRYLSMRHPKERAIFKIQSAIVHGIREFLIENNFTEIRTPKIVKEGAEGGANIFSLEYFGQTAYLTQSPQFYKEFCVGIFDRVFEIAPVFRAEKHNTSRHINEYTSIDVELSNIDSFYDVMNIETAMLKHCFAFLKKVVPYELELLEVDVPVITDIPALDFYEVKKIVSEVYKIVSEEPDDLAPIEELKIAEYVKEKYKSDFVFITHYPFEKRPFYTKDDSKDPKITSSFDLIFRGIEITSGGQRIHDYNEIIDKLTRKGLNPKNFEFFTTAHKHGLPPHGGLGIGLERVTQRLLGLENIKSATMYPRDIHRLTP